MIRRFGHDGWLVDTDEPLALAAALTGAGLVEVVPGDAVVLLRGDDTTVRSALDRLPEQLPPAELGPIVELPATWDGEDLEHMAESAGLTAAGVVTTLRETVLTVSFCGFSPGFGYLTGLPEPLHIPRRARPRQRVPAGSIAIAAGYAAVYPTASPGGWHLLGTCRTRLFDPDRPDPALLAPGVRVRFV